MRFMVAVFLSASIAFLGSCSKSEDNPTGGSNTPTKTEKSVSATIEGVPWTSDLMVTARYSNNIFSFSGVSKDGKSISVTMMSVDKAGEYTIGGMGATGTLALSGNEDETYSTMFGSGPGTINITKLTSTEAEGTFSFTPKNIKGVEKKVTNGKFKVSY